MEFYDSNFQNFLKNKSIINYSRNTSSGAVFAERFDKSIRNLLEKRVFWKRVATIVGMLPSKTKHYNYRIHSSTKLTPTKAGLKKNEGFFYKFLLDKRKKIQTK